MREILFKAKMLDDGEWIEGTPVDVTPLTCLAVDAQKPEVIMVRAGFADWGMPRGLEGAKVDPETVCQYTGLTDKNGVKIFEGDIVIHDTKSLIDEKRFDKGKIVFDEETAQFARTSFHEVGLYEIWRRSKADYEVIGNIHDKEVSDEQTV